MHFVNPLPFLLDYGIFVPLFLRVIVSYFLLTTFLLLGKVKSEQTDPTNVTSFSFIENNIVVSIIRFCIPFIIVLVLVGAFTQIAAILSIIIFIGMSLLQETKLFPVGKTSFLILIVIAVCLLVSGGGHYALDYPL